jgi:hypothetical protein
MKKNKLNKKLLTNEQEVAVSQMIIASFYDALTQGGKEILTPAQEVELRNIASAIAYTIVQDTQRALLQNTVFEAAVESSSKKSKPRAKKTKVK